MKIETEETKPSQSNGYSWSIDGNSLPSEMLESESTLASLANVFFSSGLLNGKSSPIDVNEKLPDVQETYKILVEQIPAVVFIAFFDRDFGEAYVSPQIEKTLGFTQEEWLNDPVRWYRHIHQEDKERWSSEVAQMFLSGEPLHSTYRVLSREGEVLWFQCEVKIVRREDGRPWFIHGVGFDITERKQTEEALRKSELKFRSVTQSTVDAIIASDSSGNIISWNNGAEKMFGYKEDEVIGQSLTILIPEEYRESHEIGILRHSTIGETRIIGQAVELVGLRKTGEEFPLELSLNSWQTGGETYYSGIIRDITERKKNEAERELIVNLSVDLICVVGFDGNFKRLNPAWEKSLGIDENDIFEQPFLEIIHPDDQEATIMEFERLADGDLTIDFECRCLCKDGSYKSFSWTAVPLLKERLFHAIGRDVSERKQIKLELEQTRDAALESTKLKSEFLANMSHEIRTPMNGVIGMTGLLLETELDEAQRDYTETIQTSADALLRIIDDILDFSKIEAGQLKFEKIKFDLMETLETTVDTHAERAHSKGIELAMSMHRDVPSSLLGDPVRIRQVLTNLIGNAIKFTNEGEVIVNVSKKSEANKYVELLFEVEDSGIGISPDALGKLFQAFVQADGSMTRRYGGTGLGLTISKQLAEMMGGEIGVRSTPDKGSTFWFTGRFEKQPNSVDGFHVGNLNIEGAKVLIVDDNESNLNILHDQVASWGMIGVKAKSGDEALRLLQEAAANNEPFEIGIIDLTMPEMKDFNLTKQIKHIASISGINLVVLPPVGRRNDIAKAYESGVTACLQKPVRQSQLYNCLVTILTKETDINTKNIISPIVDENDSGSKSNSDVHHQEIKILVAEDNIVNQKVTISQLQKLGYQATIAKDGVMAIEEFKKNEYDIVLMDVQMPEMDGFEATAEIRRLQAGSKRTPIIALTAHALEGEREICLEAGMDDYLSKPIKMTLLEEVIKKWSAKETSE